MTENGSIFAIKWNEDKMSVGHEVIDKQHKELLEIMNELISSIYSHSQINHIENIIKKLLEYSEYHFETEEKVYSELGYDNLQGHKDEHNQFTDKIKELHKTIVEDDIYKDENCIEISADLLKYLGEWFVKHDINNDKRLLKNKQS